ncbi:AAA family ATPase [Paraburkholderia sp. J8-2]|uniref:AAA family ATPase n=1 Tax=Paraburkholderia sp. J8-2 TaxID=2805440 RepID=UPI002AB641BB|nr:AAA family ATPase [Paraburkholderia sp. J8-2]
MNPLSMIGFMTIFRGIVLLVWANLMFKAAGHFDPHAASWGTVLAAALIVFPDFRSWPRLCIAFVMLSAGLLRCATSFSEDTALLFAVWAISGVALYFHPASYRYLGVGGVKPSDTKSAGSAGATVGSAQGAAPAPQPSVSAVQAPKPSQPAAPQTTVHYDFGENKRAPRYRFADMTGMSETKKRLLAASQDIIAGRGKPRNGILVFGDPGNGKTMFAEALAGEMQVPFFSIAYGDVNSMWVGEAVQKVKAVFSEARKLGFGVFFIDEFDSFVKNRGGPANGMGNGSNQDRDLTNVMLTEIVNLRGTKIVLIAATNLLDDLDGASVREGRFDFKVEVPPPDFEARQAILRRSIGEAIGFEFADAAAIEMLAERWEGFSASRLSAIGDAVGDLRRDGEFSGKVTFDIAVRALRLLQGRKGALPENVKSIDEILMPAESRNAIRDLAFKMSNVYNLEKIGGRLPAGVLFLGPPGTGKTQSAMSLAKDSGAAFLKITGAEIVANPAAWDKLYRTACDIRPAIIFIDEADGILRNREFSHYGMLTEKILTTMDGAGGRVRDVMFIAATNYFDRVDSAAVRGGRFEEKIVFDVPENEDMAGYIQKAVDRLSESWELPGSIHAMLCERLLGRSIADADAVIQKTVDAAAVRRLREETTDIRESDVEAAARAVLLTPGKV